MHTYFICDIMSMLQLESKLIMGASIKIKSTNETHINAIYSPDVQIENENGNFQIDSLHGKLELQKHGRGDCNISGINGSIDIKATNSPKIQAHFDKIVGHSSIDAIEGNISVTASAPFSTNLKMKASTIELSDTDFTGINTNTEVDGIFTGV